MTQAERIRRPAGRPAVTKARMLTVTAPFDGSVMAEVSVTDRSTVEEKLAAASDLHKDRDAWLKVPARIEILRNASTIMAAEAEELAVSAAQEGGKPLIDSRIEVQRAID